MFVPRIEHAHCFEKDAQRSFTHEGVEGGTVRSCRLPAQCFYMQSDVTFTWVRNLLSAASMTEQRGIRQFIPTRNSHGEMLFTKGTKPKWRIGYQSTVK